MQMLDGIPASCAKTQSCVSGQADVARAIKEECEGELAVAMPILEDALAALDTIKEADITYIRKLGNPPAAIKLVMEVCCFMCLCPLQPGSFNPRLKYV